MSDTASKESKQLTILPVRKSSEFKQINNRGKKFISRLLILYSHPTSSSYSFNSQKGQNSQHFCRVGYTVSKTVGNAVVRNRGKRLLREAFRDLSLKNMTRANHDYVIIARKGIEQVQLKDVIDNLKFCLKRIDTVDSTKGAKSSAVHKNNAHSNGQSKRT